MSKKILLINPPYPLEESPSPPYGLISLAAYLIEQGHEVKIEDYIVNPYSNNRIRTVIKNYKPEIVGATSVTMNVNQALNILRDYREVSVDLVTVMGGPHVSFDAENVLLENKFVDFIVRGEGEITFTELCENLGEEKKYSEIDGLSYRSDGQIVHNKKREFIEDINILPSPARHLLQLSKYKAIGLPVNMITSRGCPFECIFCVGSKMVGRKVRYFSVDRVVDEFEMLSKMGFKQINIADDLFTSNKKRCISICDEIVRRDIVHPWTAFARVDTVSVEMLTSLKKSGCIALCFGIESGNQEILDTVKKKTNLSACKEAVEMCYEAGIDPMTSYILGLPGETPETVRQTVDLSKSLSKCYGYHILAPFPGTEVRERSDEYGIRILTDDWDKYDANRSVSESVSMPSGEIDRIVDEFNAGINYYIKEAITKHENKESVPDDVAPLVSGIRNLEFALEIINSELIEKFHAGSEKKKSPCIENLIEYITENTGFNNDRVCNEVDRLLKIKCLTAPDALNKRISWA